MPCNCDYMKPSSREIELSHVACLLNELDGKKWKRSYWEGYHPAVYCQFGSKLADQMVAQLCERLQSCDVTKYSLEMQIWWRDHQEADKKRIARELREQKTTAKRKAALEKLTPRERKLLGLHD